MKPHGKIKVKCILLASNMQWLIKYSKDMSCICLICSPLESKGKLMLLIPLSLLFCFTVATILSRT